MPTQQRIMSGMRPTGKLHLGHYLGVLKNWVDLQRDYQCFFSVVDWHALTTKYAETDLLAQHRIDMVRDWLAAGVDPNTATIYVQSAIPEIAELSLLFSMLVPTPWVEGDPTLKDMVKDPNADIHVGLLSYPILQTADILVVRGDKVPVGKDQLAHLEISRKIAKRFNHTYQTDFFPEPQPLLTATPLLMGLDGNKMGKSNNNGILLSDTEKATAKKINQAITDRGRIKREDPGDPTACEVVFPYYQLFTDEATQATVAEECRNASRGCGDCKKQLAATVNELLAPMRERHQQFSDDDIRDILLAGNQKTRQVAGQTLEKVRKLMKLC